MADIPPSALTMRERLDRKLDEAERLAKGTGGGGGRKRQRDDFAVERTETQIPFDQHLEEIGRSARGHRELASGRGRLFTREP